MYRTRNEHGRTLKQIDTTKKLLLPFSSVRTDEIDELMIDTSKIEMRRENGFIIREKLKMTIGWVVPDLCVIPIPKVKLELRA